MDLGDIGDKVEGVVDQVAEKVDEVTGGKFSDQIDQVAETIKDKLPGHDGEAAAE